MERDPLDRLFERFARRGDTRALGEVYDALAPKLYRVALHLARDGAEAEDLLQATFVTAIERAATYSPEQPLEPWLSGILANHARNSGRRAARSSTADVAPIDTAASPGEEASRIELDESLARALERLPEAYRPALVLRFRHGLSVSEIAEALGIPPGTVRSQLARGTEHLRRKLPAGIEGVRALVLAKAELASTSLAIGGMWIVKKWIAAAVLVLLLSGAVSYGLLDREAPQLPPATPAVELAQEPRTAESVHADAPHEARSSLTVEFATAPQAVPSTGSVVVEAHYAGSDEPASGVAVVLRVDHRDVSYLDERCAELDAAGRATWAGLPQIWVLVHALPGGEASGMVKPGEELHLSLVIPSGVDVSGEVVDSSAQPVAGARIWISEPNMPALGRVSGRADGQGRFRLRAVGANRWIGAKSANMALSYLQCVRGAAGSHQELRIVLEHEGAKLSGRALDDEGHPVPHAQVLAGAEDMGFDRKLADGLSVPSGAPQRAEADDQGRFELDGLPLGPCTLRARAPGLVASARSIELLPGANAADIVLEREAVVEGTLSDAAGTPVMLARVYCGEFGRFDTRATNSLTGGKFALYGLAPGECKLVAELPDGPRAETRMTLRAGEHRTWNPQLVGGASIRGVVCDRAGRPLAGWGVLLSDEVLSKDGWQSGNTGVLGEFQLPAEQGRSYRLSVFEPQRWSDFPRATQRGLLVDGRQLRIEIGEDSLAETSLTGRILDGDGRQVGDARLLVLHIEEQIWRELTPDEHGDVRLAHVPPGHLRLEVRSLEHPWLKLGEREARAGERLDLGTIELAQGGRVAGSLRGGGRAGLEITVADVRGMLAGSIEMREDEYRSNALAPGRYSLYVRGPNVGDQRHELEIAAGRELRLDLVLESMSTCKLLLQAGERMRASKYVTCFVSDGTGRQVCMRSLAVAGAASVAVQLPLPAGTHKLVVWGEGGKLLETQISASGAANDPALTLIVP